ncbi:hypothetical protein HII36_44775 [Nonomuraea sp. NN258]|uniref:SMI1/KNR4 family protein n=1 Tax=Nonomuraea antri TaxID=2730852 RepID=UPI00156985AF|nr:SMI1/KNR4 family protein [Nonomuraea antri]NRQ38890.1 hypothetical protein [Nonomuraea antri]
MLKLVRSALTAAVLIAIVIRVRRRARLPEGQPAQPAPAAARGARVGLIWVLIAVVVAVTLTIALIAPTSAEQATAPRATATATPTQVPTPAPTSPSPTPEATCVPPARPVVVRPIDPRVRRAVNREWRRVERWLMANAPRTYRRLGGPGRAGTIAVAESQLGVDFPDDLRASLLRHNGSPGLALAPWPGGGSGLTIRQIRDAWRRSCATAGGQGSWAAGRLPFQTLRPAGLAVIDTDKGTGDGTAGGMVTGNGQGFAVSYHALLRQIADTLEQGAEFAGLRPAVERGALRWQPAE